MMKTSLFSILLMLFSFIFYQCSPADKNFAGSEYMPDMVHSIAYEPNVNSYYYYHSWGAEDVIYKMSIPRYPVKGTIARGSIALNSDSSHKAMNNGNLNENAIRIPANGSVPYYYQNTEEGRAKAMKEINSNPLSITDKGLQEGKMLYNIYCAICHGELGDGSGYLLRDDGGKYPAQPANFLKDEFIAASEGRLYHSIIYGRNMMGSYADKISYSERWNVIHYIRSLQANSKKLKYSEKENTFSGSQAVLDAVKAFNSAAVPANVNNVNKK